MTREEAKEWLTNEKWKNANNKYKKEWNEAFDMAIEALSPANLKEEFESADSVKADDRIEPNKIYCSPLVAENVEVVVRCKDCRHRDLFSCPLADNDFQKDDDYCSWGERSEE